MSARLGLEVDIVDLHTSQSELQTQIVLGGEVAIKRDHFKTGSISSAVGSICTHGQFELVTRRVSGRAFFPIREVLLENHSDLYP